jgi:hypothetical protein
VSAGPAPYRSCQSRRENASSLPSSYYGSPRVHAQLRPVRQGRLEVSVPAGAVKPEGTRIPVQDADAIPEQQPRLAAMPE